MTPGQRRRAVWLIVAVAVLAPVVASYALQSSPDLLGGVNALRGIAAPDESIEIHPRLYAAYGALVAASTLGILYLHLGRAFVVYWIASWTLFAASLMLVARGYDDVRLGSVMIGLSQLLAVWSAGLVLLSVHAFSNETPHRWNAPLQAGAISAVWFLASPFVLPLPAVIYSGPAASAVLHGWASARYAQLTRRSPIVGAFMISGALAVMSALDGVGALVALRPDLGTYENNLLGLNVITSIFIALGMHLLVFEDVTDEIRRTNLALALANEQVRKLAITDPLTGCHNRRFFDEIERREMGRHRRYDRPLSVMFVDLNRFKHLNDTYGHDMGDNALRTCGALLRRQIRGSDYVIRWGGDEFLLLLSCTAEEALQRGKELKAAFARERDTAGLPEAASLSIGVADVRKDAESFIDAIRLADAAMYRDKLSARAGT
jgi:diguanylate cyclase (GGDEF)-like protein